MAIQCTCTCVHISYSVHTYVCKSVNAIVHFITPGKSVQLWFSLVGILIID